MPGDPNKPVPAWAHALREICDRVPLKQKEIAAAFPRHESGISLWFSGEKLPKEADVNKILDLVARRSPLTQEERQRIRSLYMEALKVRDPKAYQMAKAQEEITKLSDQLHLATQRAEQAEARLRRAGADRAALQRQRNHAQAQVAELRAQVIELQDQLTLLLDEAKAAEERARRQQAENQGLHERAASALASLKEAERMREQLDQLRRELADAHKVISRVRQQESEEHVVAEALKVVTEAERVYAGERVVGEGARTRVRLLLASMRVRFEGARHGPGGDFAFFIVRFGLYGLLLTAAAGVALVRLAPLSSAAPASVVERGWWCIGVGAGAAMIFCLLGCLLLPWYWEEMLGALRGAAAATGALALAAFLLSIAGDMAFSPKATQPVTATLSHCYYDNPTMGSAKTICTYTWAFNGKHYKKEAVGYTSTPVKMIRIDPHHPSESDLNDPGDDLLFLALLLGGGVSAFGALVDSWSASGAGTIAAWTRQRVQQSQADRRETSSVGG